MLKGKVILITGASRGFGAALAQELDQYGAKLILTARSKEDLESVSKSLKSEVLIISGDLTEVNFRKNLIAFVKKECGRLDILINNAGRIRLSPFEKTTEEDFDLHFDLNVRAPISLTRLALPLLRKSKGDILNIISTAGLEGSSVDHTHYYSSKFAMTGFTHALRNELPGSGIRALAFYPGGMKTHLENHKHPNYKKFMDPASVAPLAVSQLLAAKGVAPEDFIIRSQK